MKKWKTLSSEYVFSNPWFKVKKEAVELPNGKIMDDYYIWDEPMVAMIVAFTENNDLLMVRQYKHAAGEIMIELPAGYVDSNENIEVAAKRELAEETGYVCESLEKLATIIKNPTKSRSKVHLFIARNVKKIQSQNLDISEDIEVILLSLEEVADKIANGEINATDTISAIYLASKRLGLKI